MTSSSILLSGHPRRFSCCLTEMSSDKHIVISNVLSSGHKSPPLRLFDRAPLRQFRKVVYYDQYLVISRLCHADLVMVYLHNLNDFRALNGLEQELHPPWIFHL